MSSYTEQVLNALTAFFGSSYTTVPLRAVAEMRNEAGS